MEEDWLKFKKYPHIGRPLNKKRDRGWVKKYVTDPEKISNHKFTPLLHRTFSSRKFRPKKNAIKNSSGKRIRSIKDKKTRHIYFASHLDSIIYGYYSYNLTQAYETYLKDRPFGNTAVAYRKIPIGDEKKGNKSNIEFSYEAFKFIDDNKNRQLSIIVADVSAFFDNLDHRLLHKQWKRVLGTDDLPSDHYAIYKNLISKRYVNENELFNRFKNKLMVERFKPHDTSEKEIKRKKVNKIYNMRFENVVAFCEADEFFSEGVDLIRADKPQNSEARKSRGKNLLKGIPQGSPISATLANVYMLDFDEHIYNTTVSKRAFYQRYSDDLIIICDRVDENYYHQLIEEEIEVKAKLEIHPDKTKTYRYGLNVSGEFKGGLLVKESDEVNFNKQLEYLGFEYDGNKVYVKTAGFSKFYRTMKRSFRRGAYFAKKAHIPSDSLFETKLYKRFTHVGARRRLKWYKDPNSPTGYSRSTQYDWGNFISYVNKANHVMKDINGDDTIIKQSSKIWQRFHELKEGIYEEIKRHKSDE